MALLLFVISGLLATPWKAPNYFSLIVGLARSLLRDATVNVSKIASRPSPLYPIRKVVLCMSFKAKM